jgi:hypothetical protein
MMKVNGRRKSVDFVGRVQGLGSIIATRMENVMSLFRYSEVIFFISRVNKFI